MKTNIVLVGYRGTGKSSVGKRLADVLGMVFVDMDQVLVIEAGCDITRIVRERGWAYFRGLEKDLLARLSRQTGQVVATGGGVVLDEKNRTLIQGMGRVIWLKAEVDEIVLRLTRDTEGAVQRPAFSDHDLRDETIAILKDRSPFYARVSDSCLNTSSMTVGECVDEILCILHKERASPGVKRC